MVLLTIVGAMLEGSTAGIVGTDGDAFAKAGGTIALSITCSLRLLVLLVIKF